MKISNLGWNFSLKDARITTMASADLDLDKKSEILAGFTYFDSNGYPKNATMQVFDGNGTVLWSTYSENVSISNIIAANLTSSPELEIVMSTANMKFFENYNSTDGGIFAFDYEGNLLWKINTTYSPIQTFPVLALTVGDLDNNGLDDVVATLFNETIIAINGSTGKIIWRTGPVSARPFDEVPVDVEIADIDYDGATEVVALFANFSLHDLKISYGNSENITDYGWITTYNSSNGNQMWNVSVGAPSLMALFVGLSANYLLTGNFMNESNGLNIATVAAIAAYNVSYGDDEYLYNYALTLVNATGRKITQKILGNMTPMAFEKGNLNGDNVDDILATSIDFEAHGLSHLLVFDGNSMNLSWSNNNSAMLMSGKVADFTNKSANDEILVFGQVGGLPDPSPLFSQAILISGNGTILWSRVCIDPGFVSGISVGDYNGDTQLDFSFVMSSFSAFGGGTVTDKLFVSYTFIRSKTFTLYDPPAPVLGDNITLKLDLDNSFNTMDINVSIHIYKGEFSFGEGPEVNIEYIEKIAVVNVSIKAGERKIVPYTFNTTLLGNGSWFMPILINNLPFISSSTTIPICFPCNLTSTTDPQEAINKALLWLEKVQNDDGSWNFTYMKEGTLETAASAAITGLAALAFLNNGTVNDAVKKAINWLLLHSYPNGSIVNMNGTAVYETSMAVLALIAYNRTLSTYNDTIVNAINNAINYLVWVQNDEDRGYNENDPEYGGWGYPGEEDNPNGRHSDLSNTQWALMALWAGGLPLDNDTWSKAEIYVRRCLNNYTLNPEYGVYNDGGFTYEPGRYKSYGSMTAAGIWSLMLINASYATDPAIISALNWLKDNFNATRNPNVEYWVGGLMGGLPTFKYYYFISLGKALAMLLDPAYDTYYYQMQEYILSNICEDSDGLWFWNNTMGGEPATYATEQAILFLQIKSNATGELANLTFILHSAADLHVYDPLGRHIGYNYTTGEVDLVPGSSYSGLGTEPQVINIIKIIKGTYRVVLVGKAAGNATLKIIGKNKYGKTIINTTLPEKKVEPGKVYDLPTKLVTMVGDNLVTGEYKTAQNVISITVPSVVYRKSQQEIDILGAYAESTNILHGALNETEALIHTYQVFFENGTATGVKGNLAYNGSYWNAYNVSVASLPEGTYYVVITFNTTDVENTTVQTAKFTIEHFIRISTPTISFNNETMLLNITGIIANCSYTLHGVLDNTTATKYSFEILTSDGQSTGISGNFEWNGTHWNAYNVNVSSLDEGYYDIKIVFEDSDASGELLIENAFYAPAREIPPPPPPPIPIWVYIVIGAVIIAIVIYIILKRRK